MRIFLLFLLLVSTGKGGVGTAFGHDFSAGYGAGVSGSYGALLGQLLNAPNAPNINDYDSLEAYQEAQAAYEHQNEMIQREFAGLFGELGAQLGGGDQALGRLLGQSVWEWNDRYEDLEKLQKELDLQSGLEKLANATKKDGGIDLSELTEGEKEAVGEILMEIAFRNWLAKEEEKLREKYGTISSTEGEPRFKSKEEMEMWAYATQALRIGSPDQARMDEGAIQTSEMNLMTTSVVAGEVFLWEWGIPKLISSIKTLRLMSQGQKFSKARLITLLSEEISTGKMVAGTAARASYLTRFVESSEFADIYKHYGGLWDDAIKYTRVNVDDPAAQAIAQRLDGIASVKFPGKFKDREFDFFTSEFIGQTKPANFKLGTSFRNQAKATFEAAIELERKPYFHFDGPPAPSVIRKLQEYGHRYNIEPIINTTPL